MHIQRNKNVFIVWTKFQRRVEVLAPFLNLDIHYFHYDWEEKSKILKLLSFIPKIIGTMSCLFQKKPDFIFVQFPPTPAVYCVSFFAWLTGSRVVSDCHIGVTSDHWLNWILVKKLLARGTVIVHNEFLVEQVRERLKVEPFVLNPVYPRETTSVIGMSSVLEDFGLVPKQYVVFPCTYSPDEPVREVIEAASLLPELKFALTWHPEKLAKNLRDALPPNVFLTGFLQIEDFNCLFANSGAALGLTKHEAVQLSGVQEAIAFEIPVVVSDLKTTRILYKDAPIYVKNDPESIASGIKFAVQNRGLLEDKIKLLRIESEQKYFDQLNNLKKLIQL